MATLKSAAVASSTKKRADEQEEGSTSMPYQEDHGQPAPIAAAASNFSSQDPVGDSSLSATETANGQNAVAHSPLSTPYATAKPEAKDILLGRGRPFQNHPGNIIMRRLLNKYKDRYNESHRDARSDIAMELIDRLLESGARFLKRRFKVGADGREKSVSGAVETWEEASRSEAYDKVCHALRSGRKAARKASAQKPSVSVSSAVGPSDDGNRGDGAAIREAVSDVRVSTGVARNTIGTSSGRMGHVGMFLNETGGVPVAATAARGLRGSLLVGTGAPFLPGITSARRQQVPSFPLASAVSRMDGMNMLGMSSLVSGTAPPSIYSAMAPRGVDPLSILLRQDLLLNRSNSRTTIVDTDPSISVALNAYLRRRT